ncbi:hypothetical protein PISMIDRAFT_65696, partial [Pisolithus microcarpus 441]
TLPCWICGDDVDNVFEVEISKEVNVGKLKAALKRERSVTLKDVDAASLEIHALFVPSGADYSDELGKWRLHGKEPLHVKQKLSNAFPRTRDGEWVVVVNHPTLLCWVRGDDVDHAFPVKISREADVADLKDALKLQRSTALRDVNAANLNLYRLLVPSDGNRAVELGKW